jgi:predicted dehydrogenase
LNPDKKIIKAVIIGAGDRGSEFARLINAHPDQAVVAGVAEPREDYRRGFAQEYGLAEDSVFESWEDFVAAPKRWDAVVIATPDQAHTGPAVACLEKGYPMILEKPMAASLEDCRAIEAAQRKSGAYLAVCHSLRYQQGFHKVKELLDQGQIGRLISMDQMEQVSYWLYAHGYVRGHWRRAEDSSFMLMAKSCHDLDYMSFLASSSCRKVSSFGSLSHFRPENAPKGSAARCGDGCAIEPDCPYSALKWYLREGREQYPAKVVAHEHGYQAHLQAVMEKPWGRCVWHSDNDVVDHQSVLLEFENGVTGTFTMTAFTKDMGRRLRLQGTEGELLFEEAESRISLKRFGEGGSETLSLGREPGSHGGGDLRVVRSWLRALQEKNPSWILTSAQESLKTHTLVFAAEKARLEQRVVFLSEMA